MESQQLSIIFCKKFDKSIVDVLLEEYIKTKQAAFSRDPANALIYAGRFSEICLVAIKFLHSSKVSDLNKIHFDSAYNEIINLQKSTPEQELIFHVIPDVLKSIYNIRNKKRVAHMKLNKPEKIDAQLAINSCDWVISQFIALYSDIKTDELESLISSIMERKISTIQEFEDGSVMILKKDLTFKDQLLLTLYHFPKRLSVSELACLLDPPKASYITTYLKRLFIEKLIHVNEKGAIINNNGIAQIESNRDIYF